MIKSLPERHNILASFGGCRNYKGRGSATILLDYHEKDSQKRFKMVFGGFRKIDVYSSPDGINWKSEGFGGPIGGSIWYASYNPFKNKFLFTMRDNMSFLSNARVARYVEVDNLQDTWKEWQSGGKGYRNYEEGQPIYWTLSDGLDLNYTKRKSDVYCAHLAPYESIMVNLMSIYHSGDGFNKRCSIHAGFSRDGFHFNRDTSENRKPLIPETAKKYYMIPTAGNILIVGERIFIYYFYKSGSSMNSGVATLRRDGFASLQSKNNKKMSTIITRQLTTKNKYLFVNVDSSGEECNFRVEILDQHGNKIPGFAKKDCQVISNGDYNKKLIVWKKHQALPETLQIFKIKFYFKGPVKFYSFWVSPSQHGESNGFIGNGGPAYRSYVDQQENYTNQIKETYTLSKVPVDEQITRDLMVLKPKFQNKRINQRINKIDNQVNDRTNQVELKNQININDKNNLIGIENLNNSKDNKNDTKINVSNINKKDEANVLGEGIINQTNGLEESKITEIKYTTNQQDNHILGSGLFKKITFQYHELLSGKVIEKEYYLDEPIKKIINRVYGNYNPSGGGRKNYYGRSVTINVIDQTGQYRFINLINNKKSNAKVENLILS